MSSWKLTPDLFRVRRPLLVWAGAAGLLLVAWMALDWLPLGPPLAALASSFVLVLFWGQLIRSEHHTGQRHDAETVLALGRVLGSVRPERSPRDVFAMGLRELLQLTGARGLVAALEHRGTGHLLLILVSTVAGAEPRIQLRRAPRAFRSVYFSAPGLEPPYDFRQAHPCGRFAVFDFSVRDYWTGRVFLLDPVDQGPADRPGFGLLVQQCVSALSATRDVPRIRRHAAAHERARLARELHDGVVQELATLDVELELIRRGRLDGSTTLEASLADVQSRLREQIRDLRHIEERARVYEVNPLRLSTVLADLVERFGRDTGIAATFEAPGGYVDLPARVCGEIARIVQEALVNVRRHSGARHVLVQFTCEDTAWKLAIEDDGQGLRTWGTAAVVPGFRTIRRPAVIEERVQSIGGTLRLAPGAGRGARLEIAVARGGPWVTRSFESC